MKRPESVKIGAKRYRIEWSNNGLGENDLGETRNTKLLMVIKPTQALAEQKDTLIHEILHAIIAQMGNLQNYNSLSDIEEHIVTAMTPWLFAVLTENPDVVDWLRAEEETPEKD